jgi:hypothetical protein
MKVGSWVSRNHWLGHHIDDAWMVRAGRMNCRSASARREHVLWVRSETLTDRESDQLDGCRWSIHPEPGVVS